MRHVWARRGEGKGSLANLGIFREGEKGQLIVKEREWGASGTFLKSWGQPGILAQDPW